MIRPISEISILLIILLVSISACTSDSGESKNCFEEGYNCLAANMDELDQNWTSFQTTRMEEEQAFQQAVLRCDSILDPEERYVCYQIASTRLEQATEVNMEQMKKNWEIHRLESKECQMQQELCSRNKRAQFE